MDSDAWTLPPLRASGKEEKKIDPLDRGGTTESTCCGASKQARVRSDVHERGRYEGIKPIWWTGASQSKGQMRRRL